MLLYGKNSIIERLKSNPSSIQKIFLRENFKDDKIIGLIKNNRIPIRTLSSKDLTRLKPAKDLQGIVAKIDDFRYVDFEKLIYAAEKKEFSLIFLDRIFDPQNLGVIIRSAACFGNFSVVIPEHNACEITEATLHVASGGENYVPVCRVKNLSTAIIRARKCGFWIVGATINEEARELGTFEIPFPVGVVLGSEGRGIRYGIEKHLDIKARIPMTGTPLSLNVAMATAIFCYEISSQRSRRHEKDKGQNI